MTRLDNPELLMATQLEQAGIPFDPPGIQLEYTPGSRTTITYTAYRFWKRVRMGPGCWEWTGPLARGGYGLFGSPHVPSKRAHRVAWMLVNGIIPSEISVCHRCDNRLCCRPDHLFLGSHADNNADMQRKGRGNSFGRQTLSTDQVHQILVRHQAGETGVALARRFGVGTSQISRIVNRQAWRHLEKTA